MLTNRFTVDELLKNSLINFALDKGNKVMLEALVKNEYEIVKEIDERKECEDCGKYDYIHYSYTFEGFLCEDCYINRLEDECFDYEYWEEH